MTATLELVSKTAAEVSEADLHIEVVLEALDTQFNMELVATALRDHKPGDQIEWSDFEYAAPNQPHFYKQSSTDNLAAVTATPLETLDILPSYGTANSLVLDKREDMQGFANTFKARGAMFAALKAFQNNPNLRVITTASAGNHALGLLGAARVLNNYLIASGQVRTNPDGSVVEQDLDRLVRVEVYCAKSISQAKHDMLTDNGAYVYANSDSLEDGLVVADAAGKRTNATFIHPFDDPYVVAGQATLGMELLFDLIDQGVDLQADDIAARIPVGGGGLFRGLTSAWHWAKTKGLLNQNARLIPVEMDGCDSTARAIEDRQPLTLAAMDRDTEGLATLSPGQDNLVVLRCYGEPPVVVPKEYVVLATDELTRAHEGRVPELAAAVSLAATLYEAAEYPWFTNGPRSVHVTLTTGSNIAASILEKNSQAFAGHEDRRVALAAQGLGLSALRMTEQAKASEGPAVARNTTTIGGYVLRQASPAPVRKGRLHVPDEPLRAYHSQLVDSGLELTHFRY